VNTDQSKDELEIFGRFMTARGMQAKPALYRKRPDPEPDILFDHPTEGPIAFEVVEIIDENWARVRASTKTLTKAVRTAFESLPEPTRLSLTRKYSDADIGLHFKPGMSRNQRSNKLPGILTELAMLPAVTEGPTLDEHPPYADVLFNIFVHRAPSISGPHFHASDVTSVSDETVATIRGKIEKADRYQTTAPMELLAYTDANAAEFPDDVWQSNLKEYFALNPVVRFRKIWVFNVRTDTVNLVFAKS